MRVMLVDDHAVVREGYRRLLEWEPGCEVVAECARVEEVLDWLKRSEVQLPDVVVLDLSMPESSGLDLLRWLAADWPALRVLVFSMHEAPAIVAQAFRAGARGFVTKSSPPDELLRCLRRVHAGHLQVLSADLTGVPVRASEAPHAHLSPREFQVFLRLVEGSPVEAIAEGLQLSVKTVANYQTLIRQKLGVASALELVRYAHLHGLAAIR